MGWIPKITGLDFGQGLVIVKTPSHKDIACVKIERFFVQKKKSWWYLSSICMTPIKYHEEKKSKKQDEVFQKMKCSQDLAFCFPKCPKGS
jgi:hypothetical protein